MGPTIAKIINMKQHLVKFIGLLVLPLLLWVGWIPNAMAFTPEQQLLNEAWKIVNQSYVDGTFNHQNWWKLREKLLKQPVEDRKATYESIRQMLASLDDPFTRLLQPAQYRSLRTTTAGELTGVGLQISADPEGNLEVIAPIEGSPAENAGLHPHDRILAIDNTLATALTLDEAAERMRGPIGTTVVLKVQRVGQDNLDAAETVSLKRDRIEINPVRGELRKTPDGTPIGYIRLGQFNANATREMREAIQSLEGQKVKGYILDLRNNPGGLLQSGVEIADLWMDPNPIVYTVDRHGVLGSFEATSPALTRAPLVVLVNRGTASASEILAGALQDTERAKLVGEQTFGKGEIQSLFDLSDGSGLAVTIATYETPSHHSINKIGIAPDRQVTLDPETFKGLATESDRQYQAALDLLTQKQVVAGVPS